MRNPSEKTFETAETREEAIREMELQLIYSARHNIRVDVSFHDMMSETEKFLDITKPIEKKHNTNKNQNLY